ncbi:MAG: hypothetical protein IT340_03445 [Chloroflexi bacterium]|nr:hypothetical protein [Chloroflexota bacterium]
MPPDQRERLQTALLYALFLIVYVGVAGLLGSLIGLVVGIIRQAEDDILTGAIIGAVIGLLLGIVVAWVGRHGAPPDAAAGESAPTGTTGDSPPPAIEAPETAPDRRPPAPDA